MIAIPEAMPAQGSGAIPSGLLTQDLATARQLIASGAYQRAFGFYCSILQSQPDVAEAHHGIASVARELHRHELFEHHLRRAVDLAENAADQAGWQLELAQYLSACGRYAEADQLIEVFAPLAQDSAEFLAWQGETKYALERYDDAVEAFEKSCTIDPSDSARWLRLANAMAKSRNHCDRAPVAIEEAHRVGAEDTDTLAGIGAFYASRLRYEEAAPYLTETVAKLAASDDPESAFHILHLAICLSELGNKAQSRHYYQRAIEECDRTIANANVAAVHTATTLKARALFALGDQPNALALAAELGSHPLTYPEPPYASNTPTRIAQMKQIVRGRDVAVLAHGPSIAELERCADELESREICFAGVNRFGVLEQDLLKKIGRRLDLLCLTNPTEIQSTANDIDGYLARADANMLITSHYALGGNSSPSLNRHAGKLLFFMPQDHVPATPASPLSILASNTPSVLLPLLQLAEPRRIYFFGGDGGADLNPGTATHYRMSSPSFSDESGSKGYDHIAEKLSYDAKRFNQTCEFSVAWTSAFHGVSAAPIYNVSPNSAYTAFQRIGYDRAIAEIGR